MAALSSEQIRAFFEQGDRAPTRAEQGRALEDLACYVFGLVPGISVTMRNALNVFDSEEIDVAFWNELDPRGLPFLPRILLVECKNWSRPVGSDEVAWFDRKLEARGLSFGILVAARGITGEPVGRTAAHQIVAQALRDQRQIIIFGRDELQGMTNTDELIQSTKEKLCELVVTGTALP
jgi:hypothetical protein